MEEISQTKILTPTPILVARPTEEVTIAQPSVQGPSMPYAQGRNLQGKGRTLKN